MGMAVGEGESCGVLREAPGPSGWLDDTSAGICEKLGRGLGGNYNYSLDNAVVGA